MNPEALIPQDVLQDRLRAAADVYSEHPPIFGLLFEAADELDMLLTSMTALRDWMLLTLRDRREFLERAVCHPGPPLSEHEDYDPEADLGELEASVLERMDLELKAERELQDIRKMCEEVLGRTPDPARTTMQVVRDLCADHSAARTYRANMEDPPAGLEPHETTRRIETATVDVWMVYRALILAHRAGEAPSYEGVRAMLEQAGV